MSLFKYLLWIPKQVYKLFSSAIGKEIISSIDALIPIAYDVVKDLKHVDVNSASIEQIISLYDKYSVAIPYAIENNRVSFGNALLNLATTLVKRQSPGAATTIAHAAIEIALAGLRKS